MHDFPDVSSRCSLAIQESGAGQEVAVGTQGTDPDRQSQQILGLTVLVASCY